MLRSIEAFQAARQDKPASGLSEAIENLRPMAVTPRAILTCPTQNTPAVSAAQSSGIDAEQAVTFLQELGPSGCHQICYFAGGAPPEGRIFQPGAWDEIGRFLATVPAGANVYYSLNEPAPHANGRKPRKADIAHVRAVAVDIDLDREKPLEVAEKEVEAKVADLLRSSAPPTLIVHSGGGRHALWLLDKKLDAAGAIEAAEQIGKAAALATGGDAQTFNIDRILALPGTVKYPSEAKRKHGRVAAPVRVLHQSGRRFLLDELASAFPPGPTVAPSGVAERDDVDALVQAWRGLALVRGDGSDDTDTEFDELDLRFERACAAEPKLAALRDHDPKGLINPKNATGDGWHFSLATRLVRRADFSADDYARLCVQLAFPGEHANKYDAHDPAGARRLARYFLNARKQEREYLAKRRAGSDPSGWVEAMPNPPPGGRLAPAHEGAAAPIFDFHAATRIERGDLENIPPKQFVLGTRFEPGAITLGVGPAGVSKSMFAMLSGVAIATGMTLTGELVSKTGPVLIYDAETPTVEMRRRAKALAAFHGVPLVAVRSNVRLLSGYDGRRLVLAERREKNGPVQHGPDLGSLEAFIVKDGIVHVVLDPLVSLHRGLEENAAGDMERLTDILRGLAQRTGASVDLIHHTVKSRPGQPEGNAGVADAARGSSAVMAAVRSAYTLTPMSTATGARLNLPQERVAQLVRLDDAKRNNTRRSARERWFEIQSVLPSGEVVPGWHFEADDPALRSRALESVGVHSAFDARKRSVEVALASAKDGAQRSDALRSLILSHMDGNQCTRAMIVKAVMDFQDVSEGTARKIVDDAVPEGWGNAVEAADGATRYRLWRAQTRFAKTSSWIIHREAVGQIDSPRREEDWLEGDDKLSDSGLFE